MTQNEDDQIDAAEDAAASRFHRAHQLGPDEVWPHPLLTRKASTVKSLPTDWLWEPRIPTGELTLYTGLAGNLKSWIAYDIAARVSTGAPWPDSPGVQREPGDVFLANAEESIEKTAVRRLENAGADLDRITFIDGQCWPVEHAFDLGSNGIGSLRATLQATVAPRLIVFDPLITFLGPGVKVNESLSVRKRLQPLVKLLRDCPQLAVVGICHNKKGEADHALHKVAGAGAFGELPRSVYAVGVEEDGSEVRAFMPVKCSLARTPGGLRVQVVGAKGAERLEWMPGAPRVTLDQMMQPGRHPRRKGRPRAVHDAAVRLWRDILRDGPKPSLAIDAALDEWNKRESVGISRRAMEEAKAAAGAVSFQPGGPGNPWMCQLADSSGDATSPPAVEPVRMAA